MPMSKLGIALRRRFKSPREALRAMGLPESLIDVKRLALDSAIGANDGEFEQQEAEHNEHVDEEELREQRRRVMAKVADFLAERKGLSTDQIAETLRDFPRNGLEHLGGRLAEDLEQLMKDRRRGMASDARRRRQAFDARFPDAARLNGTPLETSYGVQPERPIATDGAVADPTTPATCF